MQENQLLLESPKPSKAKLALGVALLLLGIILVFGKPNQVNQVIESFVSTSFSQEPVVIEGLLEENENAAFPSRIVIPQLAIDLPVSRSEVIGGYWEVFEDKAGWGVGSGSPGEIGNQVIFAHARDGLFLPLKDVGVGTKVTVFTEDSWFDYEVIEVKEVFHNQIEVISATTD